jgi:hypothetical protein
MAKYLELSKKIKDGFKKSEFCEKLKGELEKINTVDEIVKIKSMFLNELKRIIESLDDKLIEKLFISKEELADAMEELLGLVFEEWWASIYDETEHDLEKTKKVFLNEFCKIITMYPEEAITEEETVLAIIMEYNIANYLTGEELY